MRKIIKPIYHSATHEDNKKRVCLLCLCSHKSLLSIKGKLKDKVESLVNFKINETAPTIVVCTSCYRKLYRDKGEKQNFVLPDYTKFNFRKTRLNTNEVQCSCYLCTLIRSRQSKINKKWKKSVESLVDKRCKKCLSVIAKGVSHSCKMQKYKNINEIIDNNNLNDKEKDHIVTSLLNKKIINGGGENKIQNSVVLLSQEKGTPLRVAIKPKEKNKCETRISVEEVSKLQNNFNFSLRQTKGVLSNIREMTGNRKLFESNVIEKLIERNHALDDYFKVEKCTFIYSKGKCETFVTEYVTYCHDVKGFINYVQEQRQLTDFHLKIGMDGGGGFLKICLSMQSLTNNIPNENEKLKSNKISCNKKVFKDSGVKKIFLIAIASKVQENYNNVELLWKKLKLSELLEDYGATISTDLKLANLMCGLMAHSSKFPCTWCLADSNALHIRALDRTVSQITTNHNRYVKAGCNQKLAKNYKNCVHLPVFHDISDKSILQLIPPPELHIMLGAVNTIVNHMLKDEHCKECTDQWIQDCGVQREVTCNGSAFTGNSCQTLLNKIDSLRSKCNIQCLKYVQLLKDLKDVINKCFGNQLKLGFEQSIDIFRENYLSTGLSVTPKIHALFFHVLDFCKNNNTSLGFYSEQAVESIHHEFNELWLNYKINKNHEEYEVHLLQAVRQFNGRHV